MNEHDPLGRRGGEPYPMGDEFMRRCSQSKWQGDPATCRWCDSPLTGRQQRWCSKDCVNDATRHHWFSSGSAYVRAHRAACERCGLVGAPPSNYPGDHTLPPLQAHHVVPALGAHSAASCLHHLDNLLVLCEPCHLAEHHGPRRDQLEIA